VNPNICVLDCELDLGLRRECSWKVEVGVEGVHLWRRCTDEREGYDVLSGIAAFQVRRAVLMVPGDTVMFVSPKPVVVFRMIVVVVDVSVQQGQCARSGDQRRNEQQRQRAVHNDESMGPGQPGSKGDRRRRGSTPSRLAAPSEGERQQHVPTVAVRPDGTIGAFLIDYRNDSRSQCSEVYFTASRDLGLVVGEQGRFHAAWSDSSTGVFQIHFATIEVTGPALLSPDRPSAVR